jgi:hypothetical protein
LIARKRKAPLRINKAGILGKPDRWWQQASNDRWRVLEVNLKGGLVPLNLDSAKVQTAFQASLDWAAEMAMLKPS